MVYRSIFVKENMFQYSQKYMFLIINEVHIFVYLHWRCTLLLHLSCDWCCKKEIKYYITYIYIYGRAFKLILKKYLPLLWFFVCISNSICYKSLHIASSKTWSFSLIIYRVAMQGFFKVYISIGVSDVINNLLICGISW